MKTQLGSKLDTFSHYPVVGIVTGVVRFGYGASKIAKEIIRSLSCMLQKKPANLEGKKIISGLKHIARGCVEIIPIIGRVTALSTDLMLKPIEKSKRMAMEGKTTEAVNTIRNIPFIYFVFKEMAIKELALALIYTQKIDDAKKLIDEWHDDGEKDEILLQLAYRFKIRNDESSIKIASELAERIHSISIKEMAQHLVEISPQEVTAFVRGIRMRSAQGEEDFL